jgi:membrane-associated phospholipid phosphatase
MAGDGPVGTWATSVVREFGDLDRAVYAAVAEVPTPTLDERFRQLAVLADHSKLWLGVAGATALFGGRRGRQAALDGMIAIGITSFVVNQPLKRLLPRTRPDRELHGVLTERQVPLPTSPSFPSGHSASAFAFANALGGEMPWVALPVRFAAAAVAWSRIHTGVHYPGDVIAGALIGGAVGEVVGTVRRRLDDQRADPGGAIRSR